MLLISYYDNITEINVLEGKTLSDIERNDDVLCFTTEEGEEYKMMHVQDCCECVYIEDICGDLDDLIGKPIKRAEEVSNASTPEDSTFEPSDYGTHTWTFYKLSTIDGDVTIRWLGESNGYYSERVDFIKMS